jgi:hypothetical protein
MTAFDMVKFVINEGSRIAALVSHSSFRLVQSAAE